MINELERLQTLYALEILDSDVEKEFDDIVQIAARLAHAPVSFISFVDEKRQWFKSKIGLDIDESSREASICSVGIETETDFFEIKNTLQDSRFQNNPFVVNAPNIRYYGGVPITYNKQKLGMLCVINPEQQLNEEQVDSLKILRDHVVRLLDLRLKNNYLLVQHAANMQREQVMQKLLGVITHDMRSPLLNLQQMISAVKENLLTIDDFNFYVPKMESSINYSLEIIDDIINWSKAFISNQSKTLIKINLSDIITKIIQHLADNLKVKGNEIKTAINEEEIYTSPEGMTFVLRNLIVNANKFTENGVITISSRATNDHIFISVTDTGTGIAETTLEKIKEGKMVTSSSGTMKEPGSGFGLMLVQDYLKFMKGKLEIESTPGKGSVFTVVLPKSIK